MDVKSNILFGLNEGSKKDKDDRVNYLLNLVNLENYKNNYPHELSGGEQQRSCL